MGEWISENAAWIFSGIGATITGALLALFFRRKTTAGVQQTLRAGDASHNIQAGRDLNITLGVDDQSASQSILKSLDNSMADLFAALRDGLSEHPFIREFFVLPFKGAQIAFVSHPRFRLNADEIPDLVGKVHILENHGLLRDVTPANAKIYRMSEDFVAYLTAPR